MAASAKAVVTGAATLSLLLLFMAGCSGGGSHNNNTSDTNVGVTPVPSPIVLASPIGTPSASPAVTPSPDPLPNATPNSVLTGQAAFGDYSSDAPGVRRHITVGDLPGPFATISANNFAQIVPRSDSAWPKAPAGFVVEQFASGLNNPRVITTAPNGDIFVAESGPGQIRVFRGVGTDGKAQQTQIFASGLNQPFGIAFYPSGPNPLWLYVANTDSVVRFPYHGELTAQSGPQIVVDTLPGGGKLPGGGHWTRDIAFSPDNQIMWVSVGSKSNIDESNDLVEKQRALIYAFSPDGTNGRVWASGLRNPVGLTVDRSTGKLWTAVNERDGLGDHLVPDYITHVEENGFYGWPWYYMGGIQDPRKNDDRPDLRAKTIVPDVLLQSHSASLDLPFTPAQPSPPSTGATSSPQATGRGTAPVAPATKWCAFPCAAGRQPASMRTS